LAIIPIAAWLKGRQGPPPSFIYSSAQLVRGARSITRDRSGKILSALRWLALLLLLITMAQPHLTKSHTRIKASGIDIVVAIDLSGSMRSRDFELHHQPADRLQMIKDVLGGFIQKRPGDRIGLVAFASQSYIAAPLTLDHDFLIQNLERLEIGSIDESSTAIGSGLTTSVNRLRDIKSKSKIVILMTDGENNAGKVSPHTAAEAAKALNIKVYTIGVGTRGLAPTPVARDAFGNFIFRNMPVDLAEEPLQEIAKMTGGKYYRADNSEHFRQIYAEIDKLEKTEQDVKQFSESRDLYPWLVCAGLVLLLGETAARHTFWRRLP
jgi:Ca-activated chloride channel homolog